MNKLLKALLLLCASVPLFGQGAIIPFVPQQFSNNAGVPLANGKLYSCVAGQSCPGTTQTTYNSSSLVTAWPNPITLDGGGFVPNGQGVWLAPGVGYKFVWSSSSGATVGSLDNVFGAITSVPAGVAPGLPVNSLQFNCGPGNLCGDSGLLWDPVNKVLNLTGTMGQSGLNVLNSYVTSYGGFVSSLPGGGGWNGIQSNTDGIEMRGYLVAQTTANNAGGYIDIAPISYNPYNGAQCIDMYGNVVQQPLVLNGSTGFGPNDAVLWVGTSPSMPSGGSCGVPLPVSPSQTYQGVPNQSFGLFTNAYFFPRGGIATDAPEFNSIQSLQGGIYSKLGMTTDQALYPKAYASSTSLNVPGMGYGGWAYQGGDVYYYFNNVSSTWKTVNLSSGGGGGGSAQGPANAIQANDPTGAGIFSGYSWLTVNVGGSFGGYVISQGGLQVPNTGAGGCNVFNCVDVLSGGVHTGLGVTADQAFYPKAYATTSGLNPPASGYGGFTYAGASVGTGATYRYYNQMSAAWATVDFSSSGSGCTLGGTTTGQVIFNLSSACTSSSNLAWDNTAQNLAIIGSSGTAQALTITGYGLASDGWNTGTCALATCINAGSGGGTFGLGVTTNQALYPFGYSSAVSLNPPASGYGGIGYTGSGLNYWIWNATASTWNNVNLGSGGGGGACPAGSANYIQYNGGTNCAASANLTFNPGTNVLNLGGSFAILGATAIDTTNRFVGAGGVNVAGPVVSAGTIQSTLASGVSFQSAGGAFQAFANGNINGLNINALTSLQINGVTVIDSSRNLTNIGNETASGVIQTTLASGVAFQAGAGAFQAFANGNINGLNINASTSLQILGTTMINSAGVFVSGGGFNSSGTIQDSSAGVSACSNTNLVLYWTSCNFQVNASGAIYSASTATDAIQAPNGTVLGKNITATNSTAFNSVQTAGGFNSNDGGGATASYSVNGTVVINALGAFVGASVLASGAISTSGTLSVTGTTTLSSVLNANAGIVSGAGIQATGYNLSGFTGQTHAVVIGACTIQFRGGVATSFSGC